MVVKGKQRDDVAVAKPARPFLKWVGGKAKLVPQIQQHMPAEYNDYYEPFVGGGALFFALNPKVGHINDMNYVLIEAYRHIKQNVYKLIKELELLEAQYLALPDLEAKKEAFLANRTRYNELPNNRFEKTVLLIFLNKTCFNGMYRENAKGHFNVPFGKQETPTICDKANLLAISKELQSTTISCGSYEDVVKDAKKGDFVYFDPPYHPLNPTSSFTSYQAGGFTAADQEKLRDIFAKLAKRGCKVMLSNSSAQLIRDLYKDFNIHEISAARSINSVGTGRGKITELLITSY